MSDNVTVLTVKVEWNGNYYTPAERREVLADWIFNALEDRDDMPQAFITYKEDN